MVEKSQPKVYVFGGGVAGMTAAHELVIRGFEVCLYEREQALGPRGLLEDLTLGGMARTQYFMTSEAQPEQLYFHVDPDPIRMGRLLRSSEQELGQELSMGDMREPMFRLGKHFVVEAMQAPVGLVDPLMRAISHALPDARRMDEFLEGFRVGLVGRQDLNELIVKLSPPFLPLKVEDLMNALREVNSEELPSGSARARMEAISSAFASALLDTGGGQASAGLLQDLLKSTEQLSEGMRSLLRKVMRVVPPPGQGPEASNYFPAVWLEFDRLTNKPTKDSKEALDAYVRRVRKLVEEYYFQTGLDRPCDIQLLVQEFADPDLSVTNVFTTSSSQDGTTGAAGSQASQVMELLKEKLTGDVLGKLLQKKVGPYPNVSGGSSKAYSALGLPPVARNWVRVICYRPQLPGEHGYRFFPSYYRHVFDTMARIPLYDAAGQPSDGTVLDNLVPLPEIGISSTRAAPFLMSWNPLQLGDALSRSDYNRRKMADLGIRSQDLLQFSLRVLRYMTSCSQRRAAEMEDLSWWQYLEGYDSRTKTRLYEYSEPFKHLVQSSSRVLAALDGKHGDARTCGNTYVQLLTQTLVPTERNNCTLNGPTSEAWFFHWRKHLERLGVKFIPGELSSLEWEKERLVARVGPARRAAELGAPETLESLGDKETGPVYFVVATDVVSAAKAVDRLGEGIAAHLQTYVHQVPVEEGSEKLEKREPETASGRKWWDRLQTLSGIQFFFKKPVSVVDGYLYCVDARWGLSAICSQNVWQDRPIGPLSGYQSILSVDIGDWNTPSDNPELKGKTAGECTPRELAREVLRQLRVSLSARGEDQAPAGYVLPEPDWIHIDESLEYEGFEDESKLDAKQKRELRRNKTPYLVPIAGDWKNRPGPEPWDPSSDAPRPPDWPHEKPVWQARHGGYPVHHDRLVFAGTWLRTFTRMTTMESANESARHAVNAILDHYSGRVDPAFSTAPQARPVKETESDSSPYAKGLFPTTPVGDYCRIWNPESHELPDFELLQKRDEECFRKKKPHPWDSLGLELLPSLLTHVPGLGDSVDQLIKWVVHKGADMPHATHGLVTVLRHVRTVLEANRPPKGY